VPAVTPLKVYVVMRGYDRVPYTRGRRRCGARAATVTDFPYIRATHGAASAAAATACSYTRGFGSYPMNRALTQPSLLRRADNPLMPRG